MTEQMNELKAELVKQTELVKAAHTEIVEFFAPISDCFSEADTTFTIDIYSYWEREINIRIKNEVLQWSSEVCRFTLKSPKNNSAEYALDFNYGSGGWNSGFAAKRQLNLMQSVFAAGIKAEEIANESPCTLDILINQFFIQLKSFDDVSDKVRALRQKIEESAKEVREQEVREELNLTPAKTGKEMFDDMTIGKVDSSERIILGRVVLMGDKISINKTVISVDVYSKTVVKVDYRRVSCKALWDMDFTKHFLIPNGSAFNSRVFKYGCSTIEEIKEYFQNTNN